jgi:coproporphyrinogen III oxidase-like Fe-S oxidoreductase
LPEAGGELLSPTLRREEYIYLRLRSEGINLAEFRRLFGSDITADNRAFVVRCLEADLLMQQGNMLLLTRKGMLVCDEICAELG